MSTDVDRIQEQIKVESGTTIISDGKPTKLWITRKRTKKEMEWYREFNERVKKGLSVIDTSFIVNLGEEDGEDDN